MPEFIEGHLKAKDFKFGIIVSRFNEFISQRLLDGALDALERHGAQDENIKIYKVPGSFEIPLLASKLAEKQSFDAIICLGALIRGETPHFDYLSAEVTKGIANTALKNGIPISYGVITTDTLEQAIDRAGAKTGNKGWDATIAAIEMVNLYKNL
jgi:6,7-dimethyl-8-ribityllumazine synthase